MIYGNRDNPLVWIDNFSGILSPGPFPTFYFPDRLPRHHINLVFTFPEAGTNGFAGYIESSLDEANWFVIGSQVSITGGPMTQVIKLVNTGPFSMLSFYASNTSGATSVFSAYVQGLSS